MAQQQSHHIVYACQFDAHSFGNWETSASAFGPIEGTCPPAEEKTLTNLYEIQRNRVVRIRLQMTGCSNWGLIPSGKIMTCCFSLSLGPTVSSYLAWCQPHMQFVIHPLCPLFRAAHLWGYPFPLSARARSISHVMTNRKAADCVDTAKLALQRFCRVPKLRYFIVFD